MQKILRFNFLIVHDIKQIMPSGVELFKTISNNKKSSSVIKIQENTAKHQRRILEGKIVIHRPQTRTTIEVSIFSLVYIVRVKRTVQYKSRTRLLGHVALLLGNVSVLKKC